MEAAILLALRKRLNWQGLLLLGSKNLRTFQNHTLRLAGSAASASPGSDPEGGGYLSERK